MSDLMERTTTGRVATWRAPARAALWVLLVSSVLFALWGTPRYASQDDLARSLKAGDVLAVSDGSSAKFGLEVGPSGVSVATSGTTAVWEDSTRRLHRTDLQQLSLGVPGEATGPVDVAATITATAQAAGHPGVVIDGSLGPAEWSALPLGLLVLAALAFLILGPQPRRVTKWGMFWLLWIPLAGGVAWWLAREAPFVERLRAVVAPPPRVRGDMPYGVRRAGGGVTVVVTLGVSILLGLGLAVVLGLGSSSGGSSSPIEPWHLVLATGQSVVAP
jgi:hypothetical protein